MRRRLWAALMVVAIVIGVLAHPTIGPPAVHAQASPIAQTAGIPGTATLNTGDSVTFSNGSQSLTVLDKLVPELPPVEPSFAATVSYDGSFLIIETRQLRVPIIDVQPPDKRSCVALDGRSNALRCSIAAIAGRGPVSFTVVEAVSLWPLCPDVQLAARWNLIPGGLAKPINTNIGPMYTYQAGDSRYETVTPTPDTPDTNGYWVLFDKPTTVGFGDLIYYGQCGPSVMLPVSPVTLDLPAGQWVMIGNPFTAATVTGADVVMTYDPVNGYQETNTLGLGQGAWAYSASGGAVTLTPATQPALFP